MGKKINHAARERQYVALAELAGVPYFKEIEGARLYRALRRLECEASRYNETECNVGIPEKVADRFEKRVHRLIKKHFGNLDGFFLNGDPRGYALKIESEETARLASIGINLHRDWGGYGILAPEL
jgi:hypothetical protein